MIYKGIDCTPWLRDPGFGPFSKAWLQKIIDERTKKGFVFVEPEIYGKVLKLNACGVNEHAIGVAVDLHGFEVRNLIHGLWSRPISLTINEGGNMEEYYHACFKEWEAWSPGYELSFFTMVIEEYLGANLQPELLERINTVLDTLYYANMRSYEWTEQMKVIIDQMIILSGLLNLYATHVKEQ